MKKRRIGTALVGLSMVFGMFSTSAFAAYGTDPVPPGTSVTTGNPTVPSTTDPGYFNEDLNGTLAPTDAEHDNGKINANQTGVGVGGQTKNQSVIKSQNMTNNKGETNKTQRTHGEYQNNTNSCASCHQVHTAAAKSLLFKDGVYNTCTACHDGTLGFYNVFSNGSGAKDASGNYDPLKNASTAGTFGGTGTDGNSSAHLATGAIQVKAAPGGNLAATSASDKTDGSTWAGEFNCASCHAPHGSYSDRLLNYNPNGMGVVDIAKGGNGLGFRDVVSVSALPSATATGAAKYIAVKAPKSTFQGTDATITETYRPDIANDSAIGANDTVILVYKIGKNKAGTTAYVPNQNAPWLEIEQHATPYNAFATRFYTSAAAAPDQFKDSTGKVTGRAYSLDVDKAAVIDTYDTDVHFNFAKGYAWAPTGGSLDNAAKADIAQAYVVKFDKVAIADFGGDTIYAVSEAATHGGPLDANGTIKNDPKLAATWSATATDGTVNGSGIGVALNTFCAACHTDYFAKSGSATGKFSSAYRHSTTSDSYTCVRCHFAHGTDVQIMKDSLGDDLTSLQTKVNPTTGVNWTADEAKAFLLDKNPSSALKRYSNMSVCWACHTESKSTELVNNEYYQNGGAGQPTPQGLEDNETYSDLHGPVPTPLPTP